MKKHFLAVFAVILGMTGCQGDVETVQSNTEQTVQETQQTTAEVTTEQTNEQTSKIIETTTEITTSTTVAEEASEDMWYNIDIDLSGDYEFGREFEFDLNRFLETSDNYINYSLRDELDFLSDEQYDTYIKAWIFIDSMDDANGSYIPITNGNRSDLHYYHETSLYSWYVSTYKSCYEYLQSVFTQDAVDKLMSNKRFFNADGELFYISGDISGGYIYTTDGKYELVEKNDSEVIFEYNASHTHDGKNLPNTSRTIKLINTGDGWRAELFDHLIKFNEAEIEELEKMEQR